MAHATYGFWQVLYFLPCGILFGFWDFYLLPRISSGDAHAWAAPGGPTRGRPHPARQQVPGLLPHQRPHAGGPAASGGIPRGADGVLLHRPQLQHGGRRGGAAAPRAGFSFTQQTPLPGVSEFPGLRPPGGGGSQKEACPRSGAEGPLRGRLPRRGQGAVPQRPSHSLQPRIPRELSSSGLNWVEEGDRRRVKGSLLEGRGSHFGLKGPPACAMLLESSEVFIAGPDLGKLFDQIVCFKSEVRQQEHQNTFPLRRLPLRVALCKAVGFVKRARRTPGKCYVTSS